MATVNSSLSAVAARRSRHIAILWYAGVVALVFLSGVLTIFAEQGLFGDALTGYGNFVIMALVIATAYCAYRLGKLSE